MTPDRWLSSRMLEFNFLPSRTLHRSRHDAFAPPGVGRALVDAPAWRASWHRHWSRSILRELDVDPVDHGAHRELVLALLREDALAQLARRIAMVLCGATLRQTIDGDALRALELRLGKDLLAFARRDGVRYVQYLPTPSEFVLPGTVEEVERLGQSILLASASMAEPALLRRFELKLPLDIRASDSPLTAGQAWPLCIAVLKDMDQTWCSWFPEIL
ncbi:SctK family type III secretion system sorting platform protein [Bordetella sp. 02P26C-1]|uniref:SctK family type III secretion system sorting platform protein n=1 Tax=Bordetella sp. 02P26C-1 TaxID=2683195 RepID=UPI0013533768|nr:SctK family type III secretion system sorting platform protein [Bordetella sp. 02P26C-1]MVW78582.1 YscK family type III secretion system sorting platform protein [Bordetella sp. 02P26C-1]